jgi:superfamily II DNA/RNA helicase
MSSNAPSPDIQIHLDFESSVDRLPSQEDFPLTIREHGRKIKTTIITDIKESTECLIVTGFTSLSQIVETFGEELPADKNVRILLGFDPLIKTRKSWKEVPIEQEIKDYWLNKGISPFKSGAVLKTIEHIRSEQIVFKAKDKLHAKLYITETNATLGSSNFSQSGLAVQHEANIRVANQPGDGSIEQYESIKAIGEYYYSKSKPYSDKMISLLEELLVIVDWQEALARAISELLDGEYAKEYLKAFERPGTIRLWPSQAQGIHQGLQILQQLGSLLVADPTGSGKTKMLTTLQIAMINWLWETGRGAKTNTVVVAPPLVIDSWKKEQLNLEKVFTDPISQGILSISKSYKNKIAKDTLRIANILAMDEAHNYLNKYSTRSASISEHGAEFVILSTATPINKHADDLLRLIQLLDPDNLANDELAEFKVLYRNPAKSLEDNPELTQKLKSYIWKFTLRRTKEDLNKLIDKEPEKYLNSLNKQCRYPRQVFETYPTGETEEDIKIAAQIETLTDSLKGLIYLKNINFPKGRKLDTVEKRNGYIQTRLNIAKALSRYRVQATLRSSRIALVELVKGTQAAEKLAGIGRIHKDTGNVVASLEEMRKDLPVYSSKWDVLPSWLKDKSEFEKACTQEIRIYEEIGRLAWKISDARERQKADELIRIMRKHSLVVAFDHTIITLHYLDKLLKERNSVSHIASGNNASSKQVILEHFALQSTAKNIIALCSDAVSEGVNLQAASAVVMLDMPSILRLAEQRIGRIDRLDSPHKKVATYWPSDSPQFALRADRNLIRTSQLTKQLMGSNIQLPEEFVENYNALRPMLADEVLIELQRNREDEEKEWEGVKDAFGDVHRLIEGPDALLKEKEYKQMVGSKATVRCKLSFVDATLPWCFIALKGKEGVSRWLFITADEKVETDYSVICSRLRENLKGVEKTKHSQAELDFFLKVFRKKEKESLPHKKRRAVEVAEHMLKAQLKSLLKDPTDKRIELTRNVLDLFSLATDEYSIDFSAFALRWLDVLSPKLKDLRLRKKRRHYWTLEDLKTRSLYYTFSEQELEYILQNLSFTQPFDLQIAACIVGVRKI